jgi:hypothetical protein
MIASPSSQASLFVAQTDVRFTSDQTQFGDRAARTRTQIPTSWIFRYPQDPNSQKRYIEFVLHSNRESNAAVSYFRSVSYFVLLLPEFSNTQ